MNETEYDRLHRIKTVGTLELLNQSSHYNRYEATPYVALDELFNNYELNRKDQVVDLGCGKGRLSFYIHRRYLASVTGVEMSGKLYQDALENMESYDPQGNKRGLLYFERCLAQEYKVDSMDNVFYFFNPFSVQIFMSVVENILQSVDQHKRPIDLILYYPTTDYIQFLETRNTFTFVKEVKVTALHEKNDNERFLIYRLYSE
ncbi:class I SAM-dependent methyltransferase [Paenisporosarcina sp. TG20]|uniref:class I SAM-dependent methyltransferase n=1 Tax=Paenisporosarcina sp. TG20 TaxID=1211706 RepID=UPI0003088610|nr:class I SAM-dependent methyltransferase [Paenisporosarcina sp. TG20]